MSIISVIGCIVLEKHYFLCTPFVSLRSLMSGEHDYSYLIFKIEVAVVSHRL